MNILQKYQVFEHPVVISDADEKRLTPVLSNFNKLYAELIKGLPDADLEKMLILELMGKARPMLINRIRKRITRQERERIDAKINKILVL